MSKTVPTLSVSQHCGTVLLAALLVGTCQPARADQVSGDAVRGKAVYLAKCSACHSVDENRVGPMHRGVLGRKAGSVKDYDYSPSLSQSPLVWTQSTLTQWLSDPEQLIPGQKMGYSLGLAQERADVVRFLATLK
jgi:cytochrome c